MRAAGLAVAGWIVGWVAGLVIIVAVRWATGMVLATPVTLKGLELVLPLAGIVVGVIVGARLDRAASRAGSGQ